MWIREAQILIMAALVSKKSKIKIPGYRIKEVRGEGAMATVYRAIHKGLNKPVALKVLHSGVAEDADYRERFFREGRAAARLNHRNIVRAYEAGEYDGCFYFAMEYVDGEDLGERLCREQTLDEREALRIGIEIASALAAAEGHDMVHRDVKPENVLLGKEGEVKLADLGLAKVEGDGFLTADGYTLGTVAFFSPEQCRGSQGLDVRSDLYALGAVLYNVLSGKLPFGRGENPALTMEAILNDDPPPIAGEVQISAPTLAAVESLMAKSREDRPQTALEAKALLEDVLAQLDGHPPRVSTPKPRKPRRRRRGGSTPARRQGTPTGLVIAMGCVGAVLGGIVATLGTGGGSQTPTSEKDSRARTVSRTSAPRTKTPRTKPPKKPRTAAEPLPPTPKPRPVDEVPAPTPDVREPSSDEDSPPRGPLDRLGLAAVGVPAETPREVEEEPEAVQAPPKTLGFDWESGGLERWDYAGEQVGVKHGGLLFKVPSRGVGTFALKTPLQLPVDVSYTVRVTTKGIGRNGVLWTTLGPSVEEGLASFAGATLYRWGGGKSDYLAGRRKPQALLAGRRHKVRIRFGERLTEGWVDDKLLFAHATDGQLGSLRLAFRLERGVGIDLRDLVVVARIPGTE